MDAIFELQMRGTPGRRLRATKGYKVGPKWDGRLCTPWNKKICSGLKTTASIGGLFAYHKTEDKLTTILYTVLLSSFYHTITVI